MATISPTERQRLGTIRPELWALLLALNDAANQQLGFTLAVPDEGGYRSIAKQTALYNDALEQGGGADTAYAVAKPGHSRHNYGAAFDVHIIGGGSGGGSGTDDDYGRLAALGESLGLVAGFYFDSRGVGKHDPYHFELDETLQESIDRWNAMKSAGLFKAGAAAIAVLLVGTLLGKS